MQVNSGTLNLACKPADFGNINFTAGELRLGFNTTLTDALALPFGAPDRVFMQSSTSSSVALTCKPQHSISIRRDLPGVSAHWPHHRRQYQRHARR